MIVTNINNLYTEFTCKNCGCSEYQLMMLNGIVYYECLECHNKYWIRDRSNITNYLEYISRHTLNNPVKTGFTTSTGTCSNKVYSGYKNLPNYPLDKHQEE